MILILNHVYIDRHLDHHMGDPACEHLMLTVNATLINGVNYKTIEYVNNTFIKAKIVEKWTDYFSSNINTDICPPDTCGIYKSYNNSGGIGCLPT